MIFYDYYHLLKHNLNFFDEQFSSIIIILLLADYQKNCRFSLFWSFQQIIRCSCRAQTQSKPTEQGDLDKVRKRNKMIKCVYNVISRNWNYEIKLRKNLTLFYIITLWWCIIYITNVISLYVLPVSVFTHAYSLIRGFNLSIWVYLYGLIS